MKNIFYGIMLIMVVVLMPLVSAQDLTEGSQDYSMMINYMRDTINKSQSLCDRAVNVYRAEAIREIESQKESLKSEVKGFIREQKIIAIVGIVVASFLGVLIGIAFTGLMNKNYNSEFRLKVLEEVEMITDSVDEIKKALKKKDEPKKKVTKKKVKGKGD